METLHIGGVADGEMLDIAGNVMSSRHSFKLSTEVSSDPLRHHDYQRQVFMVKREGADEEGFQAMVWDQLSGDAANALIEFRIKAKVVL